jgi:hypothetical protein
VKSLAYHAAKLAIRPKGPLEEAIFEHIWQQTPLETVLAELMRADALRAECTSTHMDTLRRQAGVFRP